MLSCTIKVAATFTGEMDFRVLAFWVFSSKTESEPQQRSLLDPSVSAKFSGKRHKFLEPQAEYLVALTFMCSHYINPRISYLSVNFNTFYQSSPFDVCACMCPFDVCDCMCHWFDACKKITCTTSNCDMFCSGMKMFHP